MPKSAFLCTLGLLNKEVQADTEVASAPACSPLFEAPARGRPFTWACPWQGTFNGQEGLPLPGVGPLHGPVPDRECLPNCGLPFPRAGTFQWNLPLAGAD